MKVEYVDVYSFKVTFTVEEMRNLEKIAKHFDVTVEEGFIYVLTNGIEERIENIS